MSPTSATATLFCAKIFGLCPYPPVRRYSLRLPPPKEGKPLQGVSTGRKTFKMVHVTDVHVDRQYAVGSEAKCKRTMCCRFTTVGPGSPGEKVRRPAGPFGDINCDAPLQLFNSMNAAINDFAGDAEMMLFTGDVVDHAVWLSTEKDVVEAVEVIYSLWHDQLKMPIYGTIGNHDVAPTNSFPRNTTQTPMSSEWSLRVHANVWRTDIGDQAATDAVERYSGCYAVTHPGTGVRILNLNTGFAYKSNFWLYDSNDWQPDPNGILAWLASELQKAEDAGQRVWIMGHISAGKSDVFHEWSAYYNEIVNRYKETIAAQFFGHSHRPEYEITYTDYNARSLDTASSITYVAPALTPSSGNPAFRVYEIDPDTMSVVDFVEYFANATHPSYQVEPRWKVYYTARQAYGSLLHDPPLPEGAPLDAKAWHRITDAFERNDTAFQQFVLRLSRGFRKKTCSKYCKDRWLRHLRSGSSEHNGDALKLGLHIDGIEQSASSDWPLYDAGFDRLRGATPPFAKRDLPMRIRAPPVGDDEEDPTSAGCSLHAHDAGIVLQRMTHGRLSKRKLAWMRLQATRSRLRRMLFRR